MKQLQNTIGYHFHQKKLLKQAVTHRSYANEHGIDRHDSNERLEFLGDAVLELCSSDLLYGHFPDMQEGELSRKRASLVCEPSLACSARSIDLGDYLLLGHGEDLNGGRDRNSILSDALEALIGAIYLDGGYPAAKAFILQFILADIEHNEVFQDNKTVLQEFVQGRIKETVIYDLVDTTGPQHERTFVVQARVGSILLCSGTGRTKQAAGQDAAKKSIQLLKTNPELLMKA